MNMREEDRQRPYAAPANVISVLQRIRSRNLPDRIDDELLRLAGVPEGALHRVHTAFRFLGLTNGDQTPTDTLRSLAAATEEQYRQILEGAISEAYREDFQRIDPAQDTQAKIADAFRPYQPRSQTSRMVILLLGLCREAGMPLLDAPRERQTHSTAARPRRVITPTRDSGRGRGGANTRAGEEPANHMPQSGPWSSFGLTDEDVVALGDDFEEVWAALGKAHSRIARARVETRAERAAQAASAQEVESGTGPDSTEE